MNSNPTSEAEVNTQLGGDGQPSESSSEHLSNPTPAGFGPLQIRDGPPSVPDTQSSDEPLHPVIQKRKVRLGQITIMSTDTPQPLRRADPNTPYTQAEATGYAATVNEFSNQCNFFISMLGENAPTFTRPPTPDDLQEPGIAMTWISDLYGWASRFERRAKAVRTQAERAASTRAGTAPPASGLGPRRKFPLPGKFEGIVGNQAITFLTQCNNYFATEGTDWRSNYKVRWALQFCEGKAGPWAKLQLR